MSKKYTINPLPRMFEQVAKQIMDFIHKEGLEPGTKLPTERNLSELLQVSRSSVREGIRVLELLNYLQSKQGEGTFVSSPPPFLIPSSILVQNLSHVDLDHYHQISLMTARQIIARSFKEGVFTSMPASDLSFWARFNSWITHLGRLLNNSYYVSLWISTTDLLFIYDYYLDKSVPFLLEDWEAAISSLDYNKIQEMLNLFED